MAFLMTLLSLYLLLCLKLERLWFVFFFSKYSRIKGFEKGGVLQLGESVRKREKKGDRKA